MHLLIAYRKNEEEIRETHAIWRHQVLGYYNTAQAHRYIDQWRFLLAHITYCMSSFILIFRFFRYWKNNTENQQVILT